MDDDNGTETAMQCRSLCLYLKTSSLAFSMACPLDGCFPVRHKILAVSLVILVILVLVSFTACPIVNLEGHPC